MASDPIINSTINTVVSGTSGDDTILSDKLIEWNDEGTTGLIYGNITLNGGAGNDLIRNSSYATAVNGGTGNDTIQNYGWETTLNGDAGDDVIQSNNKIFNLAHTQLNGGAGNDFLSVTGGLSGGFATVNGGTGTDTLDVTGSVRTMIQYAAGDGNDVVYGYYDADSVKITNGTVQSVKVSGNDVIINVGSGSNAGSITLKEAAGKVVTLINANGSYSRKQYNADETITAASYGSTGDDVIVNTYDNIEIDGGSGNDYIVESKTVRYIGNTWNVTGNSMKGGRGDDTMVTSFSTHFKYTEGDGDDVIVGYHNYNTYDSVVEIVSTSDPEFYKSGDDYVIKVGDGSITFKDALQDEEANYILVRRRTTANGPYQEFRYTPIPDEAGPTSVETVNAAANAQIDGSDAGDYITNNGAKSSVYAGAGDDTVINNAANAYVDGADGNDVLYNNGATSVIDAGAGDDLINNQGNGSTVNAGAGDDYIYSGSSDSTAGKGSVINAGAGNDVLEIYSPESTINGGSGNDVITNFGAKNVIDGGADADEITNNGEGSTVKGGAGADLIINTADDVYIDAGAGNDTITNMAAVDDENVRNATGLVDPKNVTIAGGEGDDSIKLGDSEQANVIVYNAGDGNDTIVNFKYDDAVQLGNGVSLGEQTAINNGADLEVEVKSGSGTRNIVFEGLGSEIFEVRDGKLVLSPISPGYVLATVNSDDDQYIQLEDDADWPINYKAAIYGENVTVNGGWGNDTIEGSDEYGTTYDFDAMGGNDVITNFGSKDTLRITFGDVTNTSVSGNDIIITVSLDEETTGTITLKDGAPLRNYLVWGGDDGNELTVDKVVTTKNSAADTLISGQTATGSRDYIINTGNNVTIKSGGGDDTITGSNVYGEVFQFDQLSGNNIITNFGKNDTLQINGGSVKGAVSDSDYVYTITGDNNIATVTLKNAAGKNFIETAVGNGKNFTVDLVNEIGNTKSNVKLTGTDGREQIVNTGANVTIEAKGGDDTITGSDFGEMYNFSSAEGNNVITNFGNNDTLHMTAGKSISYKTVGDDVVVTLKGNAYTGTVTLLDAAGKKFVKNGSYLTVQGISTINNSTDKKQVKGTEFDDLIVNSGENVSIKPAAGNDTVTGSDEYGEVILASSADGDKNIITNFGANDSLKMIAGKTLTFETVDNDVIVNLQGKSYSSTYTLKDAANLTFSYDKKSSVLTASSDEPNYIYQYEDGKKIAGTAGNDFIINTGANVTVQAGTGSDTIQGSSFGELYQLSSADGNNVLLGFGENDTIQMTAGKNIIWAANGEDMIVTLKGSSYTGVETLVGAAGLGFETVKSGGVYNLVVKDVPKELVNTTNDKKFSGTKNGEVILNYGDNVTVNGAGGADTITGSDAYGEVFTFTASDGKDIITNFGDNDTIKMTSGSIASYAFNGDGNLVVNTKNGSTTGSITLQNVSDKEFTKLDDRTLIVKTDTELEPNSEDGKFFAGTPNDDHMINYGQEVTIDGGEGNDTIDGSDEYAEVYTFDALGGKDVITNFGKNDLLKITYGALTSFLKSGDDYTATVVDDDGNTGTITLKNTGSYNFNIRGGEISVDGKQTIVNRTVNTTVEGSDFDDRIINSGDKVTINGRGGNDTITGSTYGEVFRFGSDGGRDLITNFGANDTLQIISGAISTEAGGVNGADVVVTAKGNLYTGTVTLQGAGGYVLDTVTNDDGTFLVVDQVDYLINRDNNKKVTGSDAADYIVSSGSKVTIEGKGGNDTIEGSSYGELFNFSSAEGNNVITNFGANDTLTMTAGKTLSFATVGADVVVTLKGTSYTGIETLQGAAGLNFKKSGKSLYVNAVKNVLNTTDKKKVAGSTGADYIVNTGDKATIDSKAGNDTIYGSDVYGELFYVNSGYGENVILNFADNDSLTMTGGTLMSGAVVGDDYVVTITGKTATGHVTLKGAGDLNFKQSGKVLMVDKINEIDNYNDQTKVVGSTGADYITNAGEKVTIQAGAGNDTIDGSVFGELFQFSSADGNNVITNFGANDTLQMTAGKTLTFETVGADVLVTLKGSSFTGYETLQGAAGLNFKTVKKNNLWHLYVDAPEPIVNTQNGKKVVGTDKDDIIISTGDNVTIEGKPGNDTITGSDSYAEVFAFSSADGDNVITNFGVNDTLKMTAGQTISTQTSGDDVIVTLKGKSFTGTVTLEGVAGNVFNINNSDKTLRMRAPSGSSAEMPAAEDGYWFLDSETTTDEIGDVDAMLAEVDSDSAIGKLNLDGDPNEVLTSVGGTKFEQLATHAQRHAFKK